MIDINYELFVKLLFVLYTLNAISNIIAGFAGVEKNIDKYGIWDVFGGIIMLGVVAASVIW